VSVGLSLGWASYHLRPMPGTAPTDDGGDAPPAYALAAMVSVANSSGCPPRLVGMQPGVVLPGGARCPRDGRGWSRPKGILPAGQGPGTSFAPCCQHHALLAAHRLS